MNEDPAGPRPHPDLYAGLPEQDRRAAELLAGARFADDRVKNRIKQAALAAHASRGRGFRGPLVLVPAGLALLASLIILPRQFHRISEHRTSSSKAYVDLSARYYSNEEIRAALRGLYKEESP